MSTTFFAQDNEFAAATGSNVNTAPGRSQFDYPPTSSRDLVITSRADDDSPGTFDVGEVYTVSFSGNGGATITDATVIRSDFVTADDGTPVEGNEGAIVFEGLDENGELTQVVWSPNFDLETWYFDNFTGSGTSPGFYTTDQDANSTYRLPCLVAGTWIRTPGGQRRIEDLRVGDLVETRDHGAVPLIWTTSSRVPGIGRGAPIRVGPGILGAEEALLTSPQHRLLIRDPTFELLFGASELLIAAKHLTDGFAVTRKVQREVQYCHLLFARHEIIWANGVETESLLLGDRLEGVLSAGAIASMRANVPSGLCAQTQMPPARPILRGAEAGHVKQRLGLNLRDRSRPVPEILFAA